MAQAPMAQDLAMSTVVECPGSRGCMCRRRRYELKASTRFSRTVAGVKYVRVTDNEMSGPLCTQCGVPGGMYTARPGVMVYAASSGCRVSIRPWEPSQYLSNSCRRVASLSQRPTLTVLQPLTCINRLCSISKWTGVTEFGEETKMNATRLRILTRLPRLALNPDSSWSS